jgi:hypothetical protein
MAGHFFCCKIASSAEVQHLVIIGYTIDFPDIELWGIFQVPSMVITWHSMQWMDYPFQAQPVNDNGFGAIDTPRETA